MIDRGSSPARRLGVDALASVTTAMAAHSVTGATGVSDVRAGSRRLLVALTGYGQAQEREREAFLDHHLVKPASIDALLEQLVPRSSSS